MNISKEYLLKEEFSIGLGKFKLIVVGEYDKVKQARLNNKYIYLYHGTRRTPEYLRRYGLNMRDNGFIEVRTKGEKRIFLTETKKYANIYKKEGQTILVKVYSKYLEFLERVPVIVFQLRATEYTYSIDIPPRDVIPPTDPMYKRIERSVNYLRIEKRF